jgi:hypothetical protein
MPSSRSSRSWWLMLISVLMLMGLAYGLYRLVQRDIFTGTLSPIDMPYSTQIYRPRGASALYEALENMPGYTVERNLKSLLRRRGMKDTTLVLLGAGESFFALDTVENFERFEKQMREGTHYLVMLDPQSISYFDAGKWSDKELYDPWNYSSPDKTLREVEKEREEEMKKLKLDKFLPKEKKKDFEWERPTERWGFRFYYEGKTRKNENATLVQVSGLSPKESAHWYTAWAWGGLQPEWQSLAQVNGRPVVIRRDFGQGSLTLVTDAAFTTNEALIDRSSAGFVRWLFGGQKRIIFDETMHGAVDSNSIISYVRTYGLAGFFVGLFILLGLFIWRGASSLVPRDEEHDLGQNAQTGAVAGRGSLDGFATQLRSVVPRAGLLTACVNLWARSPSLARRYGPEKIEEMRRVSQAKGTWAERYRAIVAQLKSRTRG